MSHSSPAQGPRPGQEPPSPQDPSPDQKFAPGQSVSGGQRNRKPLSQLTAGLKKASFTWLLVRGILAILLGLLLLFAPGIGGTVMAIFAVVAIGIWLIFDGITSIGLSVQQKREGATGWGWTMAAAIIAVVAGILALAFPLTTGLYLGLLVLYFMAFGLIVRGVVEIGARNLGAWGVALGIINIIFGILIAVFVFSDPLASLLALVWIAGIYGVIFGIVSIVVAVRIRKL